ncbi:hypothetical protein SMACR_12660 [Sordaria macrospora]|jgi:hypothetical protein|uniref:WGS project CABT00000000 data, contig 2.1583 n=2 Tax=Sordaria macrospora TaxID=5147 RepID=F7WD34_SORMK|nr:uncharacterized protein SMAC_12660 [Sordaria macrospora k-hell]KAA8628027.1 hypothetical protein SMACR_12660 [Sordaria macrospora]CCC14781.1 unnamed protein product [Sordaria macrospora k-hell]
MINVEKIKLNPWFITGLSDGDGSFYIVLRRDATCRFGYSVSLEYKVVAEINPLNLKLLESVQDFFEGSGTITVDKNTYLYVIRNRGHLRIVWNHFHNYPLQTTKHIYFILWSRVLNLLEKKDHYTIKGFMEILSIKAIFPTGLNDNIKRDFPNVLPITRTDFIPNTYKLDGHWVAGFTQADGSFGLNYTKVSAMTLGYTCLPQFRISQNERDLIVLKRIIECLGCGNLINVSKTKKEWVVSVSNSSQLYNTIIPFFKQYAIYGAKYEDYKDFSLGIEIISKKGHLTAEGLDQLKEIITSPLQLCWRG